jgi:hypothetical protein
MAFSRNNNPVRFRVRKDAARADSPWVCDFHAHGKRIRKFFPTEELAWVEGAKLTTQVEAKGVESLAADKSGLTVAAAVRMFVNEADPQSNSHRQKLEIFQRAFPAAFRGLAGDIEPAAIRKWIKARSANGNTQAMYYRYCRMFFAYLKSNRLIADDPMGGVPAPKTKPGRNILTPAQMKALLDLELPNHVRALLLLGGFAGLRTEEVSRMTWDNREHRIGPDPRPARGDEGLGWLRPADCGLHRAAKSAQGVAGQAVGQDHPCGQRNPAHPPPPGLLACA